MNHTKYMSLFALSASLFACSDVEKAGDDHHHHHEVITTITLSLTSEAGSTEDFSWTDVELDGSPIIDDVVLTEGMNYTLSVSLLNEQEDPAEDITEEISDEADEHQFFFTGSGVEGPATGDNANALVEHAYADSDPNGLPLGMDNELHVLMTGSSEMEVTLRHMPLEDGNTIKNANLADTVATEGFDAIGGDNDFSIVFPLIVQ